jgi:hypothetical protein
MSLGMEQTISLPSNPKRRAAYRSVFDRTVLAVAVQGGGYDWACYIKSVEGTSHAREADDVYRHGSKVNEEFATLLFPDFAEGCTYRT